MPEYWSKNTPLYGSINETDLPIVEREYDRALYQLGTLGGGNHFIELQVDSEDNLWIMIHSGSRNLGATVANYYNKMAIELNEKWHTSVPKEWQLAFLPMNTGEGQDYMREMKFCVDFALANRKLMMDRVKYALAEVKKAEVKELKFINIPHNYAAMENHFNTNVMIHRKGATKAMQGEFGIIPGSQGSKSYIVSGASNTESFKSCSHGAGRKLGRNAAKKTLNLEDEIKLLNDQGIVHGIKTVNDLDEATGAYKDIDTVMENQKDLVNIVVELKPIAVVKG